MGQINRINIHILSLEKLFSLEFGIEDSLIKFYVEFDISCNLTQLRVHCTNVLLNIYPKLGKNFGVGSFMDANGCDIDHTVPILENYEENLDLFTYLLDKTEKSEFKISQYVHLKQSVAGSEASNHIRILKLLAARSKKRPLTKIDDDSSTILPIVEQDSLDFTSNSIDMPNILSKSCLQFVGDLETSILMDLDIDNDHRPSKQPRVESLEESQCNYNNDITLEMLDIPDLSVILNEAPSKKASVISVPSSEIDEIEEKNKTVNAKPLVENKSQKVKEIQKSKTQDTKNSEANLSSSSKQSIQKDFSSTSNNLQEASKKLKLSKEPVNKDIVVNQPTKATNTTSKTATSKPENLKDTSSTKLKTEVETESESGSGSESGSESDSAIILSSIHSDQELVPKENKNQQIFDTSKSKNIEKPVGNSAEEVPLKSVKAISENNNIQNHNNISKPLSEDGDSDSDSDSDSSEDLSDEEEPLDLASLKDDHSPITKKDSLNVAKSDKAPRAVSSDTKSTKLHSNQAIIKQSAKGTPTKTVDDLSNINNNKELSKAKELELESESESESEDSSSGSASSIEEDSSTQSEKPSHLEVSKPINQLTPQKAKAENVESTIASRYNLRSRDKVQTPSKPTQTKKESEIKAESESGSRSEESESESQPDTQFKLIVQKSQAPDTKQSTLELKESNPATIPSQTKQIQKASETESESSSESEDSESETETESESESEVQPNQQTSAPKSETNQHKSDTTTVNQQNEKTSKLAQLESTKKSSEKNIVETESTESESSLEEEYDSDSESETAITQPKTPKVALITHTSKANDKLLSKPSTSTTVQANKPESSSESESDSDSSDTDTDSSSEEESPLKSINIPKANGNNKQAESNQAPKSDVANGKLTVEQQIASQAAKRAFFPKVEAPQITLTQMAQLRNTQIRSKSRDSKLLTKGSLVDLKRLRTDNEESSSESEASESEEVDSDSDSSSSEDESITIPTPKIPKLAKSTKKANGKSDLFSLFKDL